MKPAPSPLAAAVLRHAGQGALALQGDAQQLSYPALAARVQAATRRLAEHWGVQPGERVACLSANTPEFIVLLLACANCGVIAVPLNFRLALPELQAILVDCRPCRLLHDAAHADVAASLGAACGMPLQRLEELGESLQSAAQTPGPEATAVQRELAPQTESAAVLLVYTSGTTGQPKGALHTQANLLANAQAAIAAQGLTPQDRVLTCLPLFHVGGLCIQTLPALVAGAAVRLHRRFDAPAWLRDVAQWRPTLSLVVPAVMRALVTHADWPRADLSSLRAVWAGSSPLPPDLIDAFHARGVPLCNVYGTTETGPFSIALPATHARSHAGSCGWPAQRVEVKLLAAAANPSVAGGAGEVCIRAPNVAQHYWPQQPVCDAQGWFHSGDLAERAADGSYRVVGRVKDMIISGGENIYPAEIENLLAAHPAVQEVAVLGLPDAQWGEVAVACVVRKADATLSEPALREALQTLLQQRLARYKQPRRWVFMNALPKTALGKVKKEELRQSIDT